MDPARLETARGLHVVVPGVVCGAQRGHGIGVIGRQVPLLAGVLVKVVQLEDACLVRLQMLALERAGVADELVPGGDHRGVVIAAGREPPVALEDEGPVGIGLRFAAQQGKQADAVQRGFRRGNGLARLEDGRGEIDVRGNRPWIGRARQRLPPVHAIHEGGQGRIANQGIEDLVIGERPATPVARLPDGALHLSHAPAPMRMGEVELMQRPEIHLGIDIGQACQEDAALVGINRIVGERVGARQAGDPALDLHPQTPLRVYGDEIPARALRVGPAVAVIYVGPVKGIVGIGVGGVEEELRVALAPAEEAVLIQGRAVVGAEVIAWKDGLALWVRTGDLPGVAEDVASPGIVAEGDDPLLALRAERRLVGAVDVVDVDAARQLLAGD